MTPVPEFVLEIREKVGDHPLWLPGVTAVITRGDGHVLLVEGSDNGAWTPVTGIVDPGEEPAVAAAREALEETGVHIRVDRLAATSALPEVRYANGDRAAYLDLTFACTWLAGRARVADDESTDVRWWSPDALPPMSDVLVARISAALSGESEARFVAPAGQVETDPAAPPFRPDQPVLGVGVSSSGWVGVVLDVDVRASVFFARTISGLVELVDDSVQVSVVAVDIPVGHPDTHGGRAAAEPEKRVQVDAWRRSRPTVEVVEVDAEASFALMAEPPLPARHDDPDSLRARREALAAQGIVAPPWFRGGGFGEDELLDACAAAWSAVRYERGVTRSAPGVS